MYISKCFTTIASDASTPLFFNIPESSFNHSLDFDDNLFNHVASDTNTINETNELKVDSSPNKRILAIPIVGGIILTQMLNTSIVPNSNNESCKWPLRQ
jgi:hypothetical protein